jgi:DNA-binding MarR family transcriptional regulator
LLTGKKDRLTSGGGQSVRVSRAYAAQYSRRAARATECVLNAVRLGDLFVSGVGRVWAQVGLSVSAGNVLMIVSGAGEPVAPHVISQRMVVTRGAVTGLLDVLEKRDLVRRSPHPTDRRMLLADATPAGRTLAAEVQPRIVKVEVEWLACLSPDEQDTFIELCGRLQERVRAHAGPESAA